MDENDISDYLYEQYKDDQQFHSDAEEDEENPQGVIIRTILFKKPELKENFEIVGKWIWASFDSVPSEEVRALLKEQGFRWNKKRKVWQNSCGTPSWSSDGDPKKKYPVLNFAQI